MTSLPLSSGRMGMMMSPMSSISSANSVNNQNKPGLLKYLKTTYNNLPDTAQKRLISWAANGDFGKPGKLYAYNSLADFPYTYNKDVIVRNFVPYGDGFGSKLKDIWRRATEVPNFETINKPVNGDRLAKHNKSDFIQRAAIRNGWGDYKGLKPEGPNNVIDLTPIENPKTLEEAIKYFRQHPEIQQKNNKAFNSNLSQRRELLARFLGVYNKQKGSFFNEIPIEDTNIDAQKYFKNKNIKEFVLTPKDKNKFEWNEAYYPEIQKRIYERMRDTATKPQTHSDTHPILGVTTSRYDPERQTFSLYDTFDFEPNPSNPHDKEDYDAGFLTNCMRRASAHMGKPIPIYMEDNINNIIRNIDNK